MNKYSKTRHTNTTKSESTDFLDLSLPPQVHNRKSISNEMKQTSNNGTLEENTSPNHPSQEHQHEEDDVGEIFGVILSRKFPISASSCSSTSSCRFMDEKQKATSSFPSMLKKTFYLRRSGSVSEGYSRIHHQHDPYHDDEIDDEYGAVSAMHPRPTKTKGKSTMFKACRSLFGF